MNFSNWLLNLPRRSGTVSSDRWGSWRKPLVALIIFELSLSILPHGRAEDASVRGSNASRVVSAAGSRTRVIALPASRQEAADVRLERASTSETQPESRQEGVTLTASESKAEFSRDLETIVIRRANQPRRIRDYSWIYIDQPQPREIKVHDIISIVVEESAEVTQDARYTRQRMGQLKAELKEFVRLDDDLNLANAAANEPTIDGTLQSRLQSSGNTINREGIRYRIAATVVDVMPNGYLVLEARKSIRANYDIWEYTLTGILRAEDVNRDNTAYSENIANLDIVKRQRGRVFDATKRPWGIFLWDQLMPF